MSYVLSAEHGFFFSASVERILKRFTVMGIQACGLYRPIYIGHCPVSELYLIIHDVSDVTSARVSM
jgi:hypothetical protein